MDKVSEKRKDYLTWDEYFMGIVALSALRGNCTYEGACIASIDKRILSIGYEEIPFQIKRNTNDKKFIRGALANALYNFNGRRGEFENGTVYLSSFPTCEESRWIAQARFNRVIYLRKHVEKDEEKVSRIILDNAHVEVLPFFNDEYFTYDYIRFLSEFHDVIKKYIAKTDGVSIEDSEYFMEMAILSALRSKDPKTQVGACLVDKNNKVLSVGYNGAPFNMGDDILPWASYGEEIGDLLTTKDPYLVHAEINAFDNYRGMPQDFSSGKLYLTYSPCMPCSMRISSTDLDKIVFLRRYKSVIFEKSNEWFRNANIICEPYYEEGSYSKEKSIEMFQETTKVIKKNLKK